MGKQALLRTSAAEGAGLAMKRSRNPGIATPFVVALLRGTTRAARLIAFSATLVLSLAASAQDVLQWPHTIAGPNGSSAVVYQPQPTSWPEHQSLTARAAIAITPQGAKSPILGTLDLAFATRTDPDTRTVILTEPRLIQSHFPSVDTERAARIEAKIKEVLATLPEKRVPLDSILLGLEAPPRTAAPVAVANDPPVIFHADRPASLVVFDGEPVLAPAGESALEYAVNTNWSVLFDPEATGTWYLLNNGLWLAAPAASGPYKPVAKLPAAFGKLPADAAFAEARKALPPKTESAGRTPTIFVSTKPAEIIVTAGPIQFAPIPGTSLQYAKNTGADLFFDTASGRFYYLVSGRWFSSVGLDGPWSYASESLPADFALIPPNGVHAAALASVPGTVDAELAVLKAQIPVEGTLKRSSALNVTYAGKPEFKPIPGTPLTYAVNTSFQVIGFAGKYYACYHGAWFVSASPAGPWVLADSVPKQIYAIPPSSPLYNVTYVTVTGATPQTVTFAYTSGYALSYVSAGVVVYGTGYYYPPYVAPAPVPVYFSYPYSYAGAVWYNPATDVWARGGSVYGPYGYGAAAGTAYNPATGAWAHGAAVYGPYGGADAWSAYNPSTGAYAHGSATWGPNGGTGYASFSNPATGRSGSTTQNWNAYSRWGSSTVSGPNKTVNTASGANARGAAGGFSSSTGAAGAGVHTATGNNAAIGRGANGDIYAGADGNAYKHTSDGWSKWENGSWQPTQPSSNRTAGGGNSWQKDWQSRMSSGSSSLGANSGSSTFGASRGSNEQRLDQDRAARFGGAQGLRGRFSGGAGRFRR
jgi:hypothetical protein